MSKKNPYNITLQDIKDAVEYVFNKPPKKERVIKFTTYCRGLNTFVQFSLDSVDKPPFCDHPECELCRNTEKAFKEVWEEWKPEVWYGEKRGDKDHYVSIEPIMPYPLDPTEIRFLETEETLSAKEIIEKYGDLLSKEQLEQLKKYE